MEITLPISSLILISLGAIGVSISFITGSIFILHKKLKDRSNYIIAILLILSGLTFLNETLATSGIYSKFQHLYFIPINFSLSISPLLYLFVKSKYTRKIASVDYLHLILPVFQFLILAFIGFRSVSFKSNLWNNEGFRIYLNLETVLFSLGLIMYSYIAYRLVKKPDDTKYFWNEDVRLWLYRVVVVFIFISGLEMVLFIGEFVLKNRFSVIFYVFRSLLFVSLILWMAYNAINVLYPRTIFKTLPKQKSVSLSDKESSQIRSKLKTLIEEDKIFLNSDLNLSILAKYLDTSEKICSKYFSTELNTNFNKFINKYRVETFKEKVRSGKFESFTLLGIAYDSGFDSKSTFNRVFKHMEGITPKAFKKSISTH